ncbi:hypothetical protein FLA_6200 [Filimonas lacunae]|nr:hypothetical protein FLA_6200 [Filimonas lacunae]
MILKKPGYLPGFFSAFMEEFWSRWHFSFTGIKKGPVRNVTGPFNAISTKLR